MARSNGSRSGSYLQLSPWRLALALALLVSQAKALYFYLNAGETRCFLEELPQDTIVVGHYKAEEWAADDNKWIINDRLGIQITVEETESEERVVNTRGLAEGKFVFTSHISGDHSICLKSNYTGGWFSTPRVRMHLDIAVGEAKVDEESEKTHINDLASKVRELNKKLEDIRKEQQYQREREHDFRTLSDKANSGAVWWSVLQISVLLGTCFWQLRTLRTWFRKQKLI